MFGCKKNKDIDEELKTHCIVRLFLFDNQSWFNKVIKNRESFNHVPVYDLFINWLLENPKRVSISKAVRTTYEGNIPEEVDPNRLKLFREPLTRFNEQDLRYSAEFSIAPQEMEQILSDTRVKVYSKEQIDKEAYNKARTLCKEHLMALYVDRYTKTGKCVRIGILERDDGNSIKRNHLSQAPFLFSKIKKEFFQIPVNTNDQPCYVSLDIDEKKFNTPFSYAKESATYSIEAFEDGIFESLSIYHGMANSILHEHGNLKFATELPVSQPMDIPDGFDATDLTKKIIQQYKFRRYVAEIDLPLSYLKTLNAPCRTMWQDLEYDNRKATEIARNIIKERITNIYVDILSDDEKYWIRLGSIKKNITPRSECRII